MTTAPGTVPQWLAQSERGTVTIIRLIVWIALRLGRPAARALLYPICLYYMIFAPGRRTASAMYLARVLGRRPKWIDMFRHFHVFAACLLDRVFFFNKTSDDFDVRVHGEEIVADFFAQETGCFLLGSHLGSFEVIRAYGKTQSGLSVALAMYEDNARKINSVLNALNPENDLEIIPLGRESSMLQIKERIDSGSFVGVLADRNLFGERQVRIPFLGEEAPFPTGPFRMATVLGRPIVFMTGIYRGGRRYDIYFERLFDPAVGDYDRAKSVEFAMRRYAEALQRYCLLAPYNWFNFYDFWK
jgi:predicted LPLAT superfamily acyltransferase